MIVDGVINEKWALRMPDFRAEFHERIPYWEEGRLSHMAERIELGMTVYDVGAELGDFTALYRLWVGDIGKVVPVEPKREMWPSIAATWSANFRGPPPLSFVGFASDITSVGLHAPRARIDAWPGCATGTPVNDPGFHHLCQEGDYHQQIRLDELAVQWVDLKPDAVVLDIEGAEYRAVRGLGRLIEDGHRPLLWVSVHVPTMANWYGTTMLDLRDLLERLYGYAPGVQLPAHGEGEEFWFWEPRQ